MKRLLIFMTFFSSFLFGEENIDSSIKTDIKETKKENVSAFDFGSYGRIGFASSLKNSSGYQASFVSHGSRLELAPYQELWFKYDFTEDEARAEGVKVRLITTIAFTENYFHYDGQFDTKTAIRQMYLDVDNILPNLNMWVGSRMYRGDDIYLLDFWPMDNLNTFGAGIKYNLPNKMELKLHLGVNRLNQGGQAGSYQYAYYPVAVKGTVGSENILLLDRQRYISSLLFFLPQESLNMNFKFYGEFHAIGEGEYKKELREYTLPSDNGFVGGFQTTYYGFGKNAFVHLFLKYSQNLAAYGEMGIPYGVNTSEKSTGAKEFVAGIASNYESDIFGVMLGGYYRYFQDADINEYDVDDFNEATTQVRFQYYLTNRFHLATEVGFQWFRSNGLNPETFEHETPFALKFAFMPTFSPNGKGNYKQPQIRFIYSLTQFNDSATLIFEKDDPKRGRNTHQYLGITAEWWFNSL